MRWGGRHRVTERGVEQRGVRGIGRGGKSGRPDAEVFPKVGTGILAGTGTGTGIGAGTGLWTMRYEGRHVKY